jgi:hypothetical protein
MYRFQLLEQAINNGVTSIERKTLNINDKIEPIEDWSPNNFRRLVIGFDWACIQHFITSPKAQSLLKRVDLRAASPKDIELLQTDATKYKPILNVLTSGRILSSVEEIVFCKKGYPVPILGADYDLRRLITGTTTLENRFPRLRHVSQVACEVEDLWNLLKESQPKGKLLLDAMKDANIPYEILLEPHVDDWWVGTMLRPKYYVMDGNKLVQHFDSIKTAFELTERTEKLEGYSAEKDKLAIEKWLPSANNVLNWCYDLFDKSHQVFEDSSIGNKFEWALYLQLPNMSKGIRLELSKNEELVTSARRIDFDKIVRVMRDNNIDEEITRKVLRFKDVLFIQILNNEEAYKRESNKDTLATSLQTLQRLVGTVFNLEVNIVYMAFIKYLTRNTLEFTPFFHEKLGLEFTPITYTRSIMEYCNTQMVPGLSKDAMDLIGATEVLVEQFKLPSKYSEALVLLMGLLSVAKSM